MTDTAANLAAALLAGERVSDDMLFTPAAEEAKARGLVAAGTIERWRAEVVRIRRITDGDAATDEWLAERRADYQREIERRKRNATNRKGLFA